VSDGEPTPSAGPSPRPRSGRVSAAAGLIALQGVALLGYAGYLAVEAQRATASNAEVAAEIPWYFLGLGALVVGVAAGLWRRAGFGYGAAVALELLALPIAWEMARARFLGAVPLAVSAVVALWALWSADGRRDFGRYPD
jgi:hypothetical protein